MKTQISLVIMLIFIAVPLFAQDNYEVEKSANVVPQFDGRKKSGLGFVLEAGFLVGSQSSEYKSPFSFNFLGNLAVNTRNIFGIGSGVEYLGQPFTPLFIEYKYLMSNKKTTPFIFFRGGKLYHLTGDALETDMTYPQYNVKESYKGGGTFTLGTGISWAKEDGETYLSFAYRNAYTSYKMKDYNNRTSTYKNAYNRLEIKFGFRF